MGRVLPAIATFISMIFLINSGFTRASSQYLRVNFYNKTDYTCEITNVCRKHGMWDKEPFENQLIDKHKSIYWSGKQSGFFGPDMALTLQCSGYSFSVRNQQNYTFLGGGKQHYSTYDVDKHLNVINKQVKHASVHHGAPGIANVTVSLKGSHPGLE